MQKNSSVFDRLKYLINGVLLKYKKSRLGYYPSFIKYRGRGKVFCVIYLPLGNFGPMAAMNCFASSYWWAKEQGFEPYLFLGYANDIYNMDFITNNYWNTMFKQEVSERELVSCNKLLVVHGKCVESSKYNYFLNGDEKDRNIHIYNKDKNYFKCANELINPMLRINEELFEDASFSKIIKTIQEKETLGVVFREEFSEDYHRFRDVVNSEFKKMMDRHPRYVSVDETIEYIKSNYLDDVDCIFISTMFRDTVEKCEEAFGDKLYYLDRKRLTMDQFVRDRTVEITLDAYIESQKGHQYSTPYFKEIICLSNCKHFLGAPSRASVGALVFNNGEYKSTVLFQDLAGREVL